MVPILMVNSGGDDVGLQLSYFQCHSDGKQVFKKAHLKVVQIGREAVSYTHLTLPTIYSV